jgi:hypothetical protein
VGSGYAPQVDVVRQGAGLNVVVTGKSGKEGNWYFDSCQNE